MERIGITHAGRMRPHPIDYEVMTPVMDIFGAMFVVIGLSIFVAIKRKEKAIKSKESETSS